MLLLQPPRHAGYAVSQRKRKRVEEVFGWMKTVGLLRKLRHRGHETVDWMFTFAAAAYNLLWTARGIPCLAVVGSVGDAGDARSALGVHGVFPLCPDRTTIEDAIANPGGHIEAATRDAVCAFLAGREGPGDHQPWWT